MRYPVEAIGHVQRQARQSCVNLNARQRAAGGSQLIGQNALGYQ